MRRWVWLCVGVIILLAGGVGVFNGRQQWWPSQIPLASAAAPSLDHHEPEAQIEGVRMVETREGRKIWEVRADRLEMFEEQRVVRIPHAFHPLTMTLYSDEGTLVSMADTARLDLVTKDVVLEGNVRAESDQGARLMTSSLMWSAATQTLRTSDDVLLVKGGFISRGKGMEAETNLERVRFLEAISSQVVISPSGSLSSSP